MTRYRVFLIILGVLWAAVAVAAPDIREAYDPSSEPKPKLPKEIVSDTRLDKHVKVFVKGKNLQQLFGELSDKTGVKIQVSRKLRGERAIIYFHDRPLRDAMTEVSGLFGYYWSVDGTPGHYSYELYEDIRHSKRRDQLRREQGEVQDALFLEYLRKLSAGALNQDALKRLQTSDSMRYRSMTRPSAKDDAGLFLRLGEPFLRRAFAGEVVSCRFGDLPQERQAAMCEQANSMTKDTLDSAKEQGVQVPKVAPFEPKDMASVPVEVKLSGRSPYYLGSLGLEVSVPEERGWFPKARVTSPSEQVARDLAGLEPVRWMSGTPLPEEPEITIKELRWLSFFQRGLLLGDVLQAMAEQSEVDLIADFYHRGAMGQPAAKTPIARLAPSVCERMDYSGLYDGKTVRLRSNKWFVQELCEEPPAPLIEACWKSLEDNGCISLDVQMELASLPDKQMQWPGFELIHGAFPTYAKDSLRFLNALGLELRSVAQSEDGVPASRLTPAQFSRFAQWASTLKPDIPADALQQSVITLRFGKQINDEGGDKYQLILKLPDGTSYPARISMLQLEGGSRKGMAEWHAKDLKADIIEVLD